MPYAAEGKNAYNNNHIQRGPTAATFRMLLLADFYHKILPTIYIFLPRRSGNCTVKRKRTIILEC